MINKVKTFIQKLLNRIPTRLPIGMQEFDSWATSILKTYGFPDNPSTRWALAVQVMHLGETKALVAKHYFFLTMHKAASNQVVHQVMQDLKADQEAAIAEAKRLEQEAKDLAAKAEAELSAPSTEATTPVVAPVETNPS